MTKHRIRWYARLADGTEIPRTRHMKGKDWGWDVKCSCGWRTITGGAIQSYIKNEIWWHRWEEEQHEDDLARTTGDRA